MHYKHLNYEQRYTIECMLKKGHPKSPFIWLLEYTLHIITSDNGKEFTEHKAIAQKLDRQIFFAHPYASLERGLSEYTNKLIRQYSP